MKRFVVAAFLLCAICSCLAQAPTEWKRIADAKDVTGAKLPLRQLGVWRTQDDQVTVLVFQAPPTKDAQGVWNIVGGMVNGLTKADQAPTSSAVVSDTAHVCFRLTGKGKQEGGVVGALDSYLIFAESATYMVKVFSVNTTSAFSIGTWDFGQPLKLGREDFTRALSQIKERLDNGVSLYATKPSPSRSPTADEDFESARNATDGDLRSDLSIWTGIVDVITEGTINTAKKSGTTPDVDAALAGYMRRFANNKFFNINREEARHPGYLHELDRIATLRGQPANRTTAGYKLGYFSARYGILLAPLIFLISRWTRRVSGKTAAGPNTSRFRYYRKLLLKMSWRVALILILSFAVVIVAHSTGAYSQKEFQSAALVAILLFILVLFPAFLLTSWAQARRKFTSQAALADGSVRTGQGQSVQDRVLPAVMVGKALDSVSSFSRSRHAETAEPPTNKSNAEQLTTTTTAQSTWWKRLFTVLEITVFLISAIVASLVLREWPAWGSAALLFLPVLVVHLLRIGLIYIIEGKSPFTRR